MQFKELTTEAEILELIKYHNDVTRYVVLDFETTDVDPTKAKLLDIQMSGQGPESAVIFDAKYLPLLKKLTCLQVFHNFKYDWHIAYRHGVDFRGNNVIDTMLLHHLYDENKPHGLDDIVQERWGDNYKEVFWAKYDSYEEASREDKVNYACKDIVYTDKLYGLLEIALLDVPDTLVQHVHTLALSLYNTEIEGLSVDISYLTDIGFRLKSRIEELLPLMRAQVDIECETIELEMWADELDKRKTDKGKERVQRPTFNFESNKQLQNLLYSKLGLPKQLNEKTKSISTDDAALENIKTRHALIPLLQEYREANKIYGTYVEGILQRAKDGTVFPSFNVNGTTTGRISHSNPNMGNIPRSGGIRAMFVPREGCKFISADYSQLEVCLGAHFSQDKNLLKIVNEGISQHDITAQELGIPRHQAKTLNFAMQYRCSEYKVAKLLDCSFNEAKNVYRKYWETYAGLKALMDACDAKVNSGEPIVSPFGRARHFPVMQRQPWDKAYRQAFNALIQGTGGDITNRAFYLTDQSLRGNLIGRGLFTVHDEILIEVKRKDAEAGEALLIRNMEKIGKELGLTVPLKVESSGPMDRWED